MPSGTEVGAGPLYMGYPWGSCCCAMGMAYMAGEPDMGVPWMGVPFRGVPPLTGVLLFCLGWAGSGANLGASGGSLVSLGIGIGVPG